MAVGSVLAALALPAQAGAAVNTVTLPAPLRAALARERRLSLRLAARVTDPAGGKRIVSTTVAPRLKR